MTNGEGSYCWYSSLWVKGRKREQLIKECMLGIIKLSEFIDWHACYLLLPSQIFKRKFKFESVKGKLSASEHGMLTINGKCAMRNKFALNESHCANSKARKWRDEWMRRVVVLLPQVQRMSKKSSPSYNVQKSKHQKEVSKEKEREPEKEGSTVPECIQVGRDGGIFSIITITIFIIISFLSSFLYFLFLLSQQIYSYHMRRNS